MKYNLKTVIDNKLEIDSIVCFGIPEEISKKESYLYMSGMQYGRTVYVTLSLKDAYFEISYHDGEKPEIITIERYAYVDGYLNGYQLYIDKVVGNVSDFGTFRFNTKSLVGENRIIHINADAYNKQKEWRRPTDLSQDWISTGNYRDDPNIDPDINSCKCVTRYRWVENGTICDKSNLCKRYEYEYNVTCGEEYWNKFDPEIFKVGEILEHTSNQCGVMEYKEEWTVPLCSEYINDTYPNTPSNLLYKSKYEILLPYIKRKNETEWQPIGCGEYLDYKLVKKHSFECGWSDTAYSYEYDDNICGDNVIIKYPTLANRVVGEKKYKIEIKKERKTLPYPENTDEMTQDQWKWTDWNIIEYSIDKDYGFDCDCGYKEYEYRKTGTVCGSELGNEYVSTSMYEIWEEFEVCSDAKTGKISYRNPTPSCDCGHKPITGYSIIPENGYEYECKDEYMYYKEYRYHSCTDGSNAEYDLNDVRYTKATHSDVSDCIFDPETNANTTYIRYRTYLDKNDNTYHYVECPEKVVLYKEEKSNNCGYISNWLKDGEICCGELEENTPDTPILEITNVEGKWKREYNKFTSNKITSNQSTIEKIYFKSNKAINIYYDQDSESSYDYCEIECYNNKNERIWLESLIKEKTGNIVKNINTQGEIYYLKCTYQKDYGTDRGRDNVILTLTANEIVSDCVPFTRYWRRRYTYSVDGGHTWIEPSPAKYKYGEIIESESKECGWMPMIDQWVTICPDITYDTAVQGDNCTICDDYNMYVQQKRQYSTDGGQHWFDSNPIEYRKEKLLKFQADKCGFTGDLTEIRYTDKVCENGDMYGDATTWILREGAIEWVEIPNTLQKHILIEKNSKECQQP